MVINSLILIQKSGFKLGDRCRLCESFKVCHDLKYLNVLLLVNILDNGFSFQVLIEFLGSILLFQILIIMQMRIVAEAKIDL